jgi:hypothetical protein
MLKKLAILIVGIIIVLGAALLFLGANLDTLIRKGVEQYGTMATKAPTTLDKVELSISTGKGTLHGFKLGNPEGFSSSTAMSFNLVSLQIDPQQITGTGPVTIKEIIVDAPAITYEAKKDGSSNLQQIQTNIQTFANNLSKQASPVQNTEQGKEPATVKEESRKIVVEHLLITNGSVKISHELLAGKDIVDAKLPTIEMRDIGKNSAGVTAAQLTQTILQKLTTKAMEVGQQNLIKELGNQGIESLKGAVEQTGIGKTIGNIFGQ